MNTDQKQKCKFIADHYGEKKQEIQAVQEFTELNLLLTKRPDQRKQMNFREEVKGEIADCLIMIEQLQQIHGISDGELFNTVEFKLARQLHRIESEVQKNATD
ncbi:MAG: hypothetical protein MJY71_08085 [Bacteroidaceae bacterium]|nr:hypothetical protein [Bacteroidaceae bacterium]